MPIASTPAVRLNGVTKRFGPVHAVDGLSLDIRRGARVAILGPNGAGKSTTIAMLLGLLAPDAGAVEVLGMKPEQAVAGGRIAAMLQDGGLMPGVRVGELVAFVAGMYPRSLPVAKVLEVAGLPGIARQRVDRLSGGQAQRVRFAMALAGNPDVLVLDEPTSGMDIAARRAFWRSIRAESAAGRTILFATHYLEEADANADRIVVLAGGRVIADGPGATIKAAATGRTVRFSLARSSTAGLDLLAGVTSVEIDGDTATLRSDDTDATLRALLAARSEVRDLEVTGASLEEAFFSLTAATV